MVTQPLVSILLLSMNHELFIEQCIESLKNQSYTNLEVIYLDNASSDRTSIIAEHLLEKSGLKHRLFKNYESKGIATNLNFLLSNASGDFISPISADDWFHEDNIEKKVELFRSNEDLGAVYSNGWEFIQETGEVKLSGSKNFKRGHIFKEILLEPDSIFYVGVLYRKTSLENIGGWDENLLIEDVDLFIRLAQKSTIDFLEAPLVYYRRTNQGISKNIDFMIKGKSQYYQKYKKVKWINMKWWIGDQYRRMAARLIDENRLIDSINYLGKSIQLYPYSLANAKTLVYLIRRSMSK